MMLSSTPPRKQAHSNRHKITTAAGIQLFGSQRMENYARNEVLLTMEDSRLLSQGAWTALQVFKELLLSEIPRTGTQLCVQDRAISSVWPAPAPITVGGHSYSDWPYHTGPGAGCPPEPLLKHFQKARPASVPAHMPENTYKFLHIKKTNFDHVTI